MVPVLVDVVVEVVDVVVDCYNEWIISATVLGYPSPGPRLDLDMRAWTAYWPITHRRPQVDDVLEEQIAGWDLHEEGWHDFDAQT